jgi:hypothetical protein
MGFVLVAVYWPMQGAGRNMAAPRFYAAWAELSPRLSGREMIDTRTQADRTGIQSGLTDSRFQ